MRESGDAAVEAFEAWCEEVAAKKARNAVPGEPSAPLVNAKLVSATELVDVFARTHPEHSGARTALESFAEGLAPGLEVDKVQWAARLGS